ncbi:peptidase [Streptomyces sp. NPDC048483]|uniref:peptidase n=1 Tax=Streptomyces sp. NPDC048483 TaxID=3154927 RepID=UPI00343F2C0C
MTTQDHRDDYLDLDAIVGSLDDSADASTAGDADGTAPAARAALHHSSYATAPGYRLKVRQGPGTDTPVVRRLAEGARIQIRCQTRGQRVSGPYGTSNIWDNIAPGEYVSDAYVRTGSSGMVTQSCMN